MLQNCTAPLSLRRFTPQMPKTRESAQPALLFPPWQLWRPACKGSISVLLGRTFDITSGIVFFRAGSGKGFSAAPPRGLSIQVAVFKFLYLAMAWFYYTMKAAKVSLHYQTSGSAKCETSMRKYHRSWTLKNMSPVNYMDLSISQKNIHIFNFFRSIFEMYMYWNINFRC